MELTSGTIVQIVVPDDHDAYTFEKYIGEYATVIELVSKEDDPEFDLFLLSVSFETDRGEWFNTVARKFLKPIINVKKLQEICNMED